MAEDVKDEVVEIPTKRLKLDTEEIDCDPEQACSSNNNCAIDKPTGNEDMPSTSSESGSHKVIEPVELLDCLEEGDKTNDEDSDSDISDISGLSERAWKSSPGTMAWIQRQMMDGQNPRVILRDLISKDVEIDHMDDFSLWEIIIHLMSEPPKRNRLEEYQTLDHALNLIKSCQKIVVLTGAGVSVSCGIPDFRSRDGIYARLAVDFPNLPDPQAMFDINFFRNDQRPFFKFAKEIYPGQFEPSKSHKFIRLLERHGQLLRNYTQNIDTLEQVAGIQNVIQCHGSFAKATCMACKHKVDADDVREDIFKQVIPKCPVCPEGTELAIMKPDIVFFGESLPEEFHQQMAEDKENCDLLIVIGSSLKVRPVALIPNSLPQKVPQILINREPLKHLNFDIELLGDCDVIISELCKRLEEGFQVLADSSPVMTEITRDQLRTPTPSPVPSPQNTDRESTAEDKTDKDREDSNEAQNKTEENDVQGQIDTGQGQICKAAEGKEGEQENEATTSSEKPESSTCEDCPTVASAETASEGIDPDLNNGESSLQESADKGEEVVTCDSTTDDLRAMWQPKKVSLAKYLEDGQYLYLPPNRYAFPGAEIYSEEESEDEDHFRNSISISDSSSCSSITSQDSLEQIGEEDESREQSQDLEISIAEDIDETTQEDGVSSSDRSNRRKNISENAQNVLENKSSCDLDIGQGERTQSHVQVTDDAVVDSQSCVDKSDSYVKEKDSLQPENILQSSPSKDSGVLLPDSSNGSM
ncbi:NAD-dependent protein deacetylase sirtuin-1-like [Saccostrea cucullata]|uniref:NAD-dependent protein deacetylase sirtuin-1-like n=1 Tax=Saccostrea cuccullata TaxID=36930 RepID=UPI002ED5D50A